MNCEVDDALRSCGYFGSLSEASLETLVNACRLSSIGKREQLFCEGEQGHSIFLLLSGAVQLLKTSVEGREVVVRTVGPGEVFAEVVRKRDEWGRMSL